MYHDKQQVSTAARREIMNINESVITHLAIDDLVDGHLSGDCINALHIVCVA